MTNKVFIIAEAGVNHNGREDFALNLVEIAAKAGADAIKFQTFSANKLVLPGTKKALYQNFSSLDPDQYSMLKNLELSKDSYKKIYSKCLDLKIEFMSTAFDEDSFNFLNDLGLSRIKIPSGEITNKPFIEFLAKKNLPLILSTGMSNLIEIENAVKLIQSVRFAMGFSQPLDKILTLLHCTTSYPTPYNEVNLNAINLLKNKFKIPIGYSDHTLGSEASIGAIALGACIIEKHFTSDVDLPGPDHKASLMPNELTNFIQRLRNIETSMGNFNKLPTKSELKILPLVRRSIVAANFIQIGSKIQKDDLIFLRPGYGISPMEIDSVIGKVAIKSISPGTLLNWKDFK